MPTGDRKPSDPERDRRQDADAALLRQARDRAAALLEGLTRQRAELESAHPAPPHLDGAALAEGRASADDAVRSARNVLQGIEAALDRAGPGDGEVPNSDDEPAGPRPPAT